MSAPWYSAQGADQVREKIVPAKPLPPALDLGIQGGFGMDNVEQFATVSTSGGDYPFSEAAVLTLTTYTTDDYDDEWMTWHANTPTRCTIKKGGWYVPSLYAYGQTDSDFANLAALTVESSSGSITLSKPALPNGSFVSGLLWFESGYELKARVDLVTEQDTQLYVYLIVTPFSLEAF